MSTEGALVPAPPSNEFQGAFASRPMILRLPVEVDVALPAKEFRVRDLLALETGQVIETQWVPGEDLPLGARGAQFAWSEFEVVDSKLAVRITRLA
jgi:flagellar motor switch protein FliN/FliY